MISFKRGQGLKYCYFLKLTFNKPGALVISLCSLHQGCVIAGDTLSTGFSKGNSGESETKMAIRLSPASNCTWYSTSSLNSSTLENKKELEYFKV